MTDESFPVAMHREVTMILAGNGPPWPSGGDRMINDAHQKVQASHLKRNAYLYVRQSTLRQVFENTESTKRQYALRQRAVALGWPQERIIVIDSDLGQSGASSADREGFQRLVTEVGMGHAGIVLGLEVSRLARNSMDWHRLLEICALTDTLILDEDGIYDPAHFNDRLLLGLKGTMSEAELHVLRARLQGGILNKARRGELEMRPPVGLVYNSDGAAWCSIPISKCSTACAGCLKPSAGPDRRWPRQEPRGSRAWHFRDACGKGPHKGELLWDGSRSQPGAAHSAQPAIRRRVRLRSNATRARRSMAARGSITSHATNGITLIPGRPRRLHLLGRVRTEPAASARERAGHRRRSAPRAAARGSGVAARTGRLRALRQPHDGSLSQPPWAACARSTSVSARASSMPNRFASGSPAPASIKPSASCSSKRSIRSPSR